MDVQGARGRGRPKKTWWDCVRADIDICGLGGIDPLDREAWRFGVGRTSHLLPTPI